ncbi:putative manganese-dependent inorganic diphosphatase [uncultured Anaerococcus sp.]|uniref:putative manganese-dependent inorganic diphosphatase n=1 Tax=uncultured Anaerococcus sp. TaxID=293428 RepID=UPI00280A9691|nr:putative manganese-dependent inorganic diphosphatase [uncultured Anaerococcus sp.]MDU5149517.1 putative manganese-dependent inorganic diphosphatase [Anaerococcus prevotii]
MREVVYITGHKNPDTDSIMSAIAYADLKNRLGEVRAIPIRLGKLNPESRFVLDYFGVDAPKVKESMQLQVKDLDIDTGNIIDPSIAIRNAWDIFQKGEAHSLSVVDADGKIVGIASLSNITRAYMDVWDDKILGRSKTPIDNIIDVLAAHIINLPENPRSYNGKMTVFAMNEGEENNLEDVIIEGDIVISGNRDDYYEFLIKQKVGLIILTHGAVMNEEMVNLAKENNVTVLSTEYNSFMTARLLPMTIPISHVMTTDNLVYFTTEDNLDQVRDAMAKSRFRSYPVVDSSERIVGSVSRYHLISSEKKKLILVDHNERNQSIDDIEEAEIQEIIDHHRVANILTTGPVFFRAEPVGSTATIISEMYLESGIRPSKKIAGILCAAIISDTLLFRSPTTTETDKRILDRMSKIADLNPEEFADKMFRAATSLKGKSATDLVEGDVKTFNIGGEDFRVGQVMTMNPEELIPIMDELKDLMDKKIKAKNESTFVLVLTDIFNQRSELLVVGEHFDSIREEFGEITERGTINAPGVLSRKKQVIPKLTAAIMADK